MPFSTFDPLSNPRTSQVLFHIINGVDTPTGIARKMGVGPTAVTDQLNRLRRIKVVKLGEKRGKEQHYEIDWRALVSSTIYYGLVGRPIPPECLLFKEKIDMGNETESRCMNSEVFRRFTESYMRKRLAWFENHPFHGETYDQFITDFSRAIVKMCDELKYKPGGDSPQKRKNSEELAKVFGVWRDWHISIADSAREPFLTALKEATETKYQAEELILTPQQEEAHFTGILLKAGLVMRDEKTGTLEVTAGGHKFLKDWEESRPKALPAWLRNRKEAELVLAKLSAIRS